MFFNFLKTKNEIEIIFQKTFSKKGKLNECLHLKIELAF